MKATYDRATVYAAALRAVDYWQKRFDDEREAYIARVAAQPRGLFSRRLKGREEAEARFERSCFDGGESGGVFWWEKRGLVIAERLVGLTKKGGPTSVTLNSDEVSVLSWVMEDAEPAQ